ncbi:MAG: C-GCAxxG-C-C family (seleno)protein [Chloroflexota bacterium]
MRVLNKAYAQPLRLEERALPPLAGGIVGHGYQCGMLWGATLAAGAQAYRVLGAGPRAETAAIAAARRMVGSFRARNKHTYCLEITEIDLSSVTARMVARFFLKGQAIGCFAMSASCAHMAFAEINATLAHPPGDAPSAPVSCAALLARKMGASDLQATMAAGLAGGIGLSGEACGALGAAIWIAGMNALQEGASGLDYNSPHAAALVEKFIKSTDCEFECAKIAGRKFESTGDHASYVREGGCSKVIEVLAATGQG